ncbi:MAG: efflux RND transporter permease subunit [Spirochaetales bacterium]|nr:efflux RND transporter permease subunit [Spirochaetales bacterium]
MLAFFIRRPVATTMLYSGIVLAGFIALGRLEINLFPDIHFPGISIITEYPNVPPDEIENLVSRVIEDAVGSVAGVKNVTSRSREGMSIVEVTFDWDTSLDLATINIRQKVDLARAALPQDATRPMILKFDPGADPIVIVIARPTGQPFEKTRDFLERSVRPFMERIPGVASVSILGGYRREIQVQVDPSRMTARSISMGQISQALQATNFNFPAGNVYEGDREISVRVVGQFESPEDIGEAIVATNEQGVPTRLTDIARVEDGYRERKGATLHNSGPAIVIGLRKEPGKNTVQVADAIRSDLERINSRFGAEVQFSIIMDNSRLVKNAIGSVAQAALAGGLIAFLVLLLFLRDLRAALIVIVTLPVAILATFFMMFVQGISLNVMSLGGLALGMGMLIDNSIIMVESISSRRASGAAPLAAAVEGARLVSGSVISSTLTSITIFLPIVFVSGIAGELFRDLALTVTYSSLASMLCSLSLIPMLSGLKPSALSDSVVRILDRWLAPPSRIAESFTGSLTTEYSRLLMISLERPRALLLWGGALGVTGLLLFLPIRRDLFPRTDQGVVVASLELPGGTSVSGTEEFLARVHSDLLARNLVRDIVTHIGYDEEDLSSIARGARRGNAAEMTFFLDRNISSDHFIKHLQGYFASIDGLQQSYQIKRDPLQDLLGESGNTILLEVESEDRSTARSALQSIHNAVGQVEGVKSIQSTALALNPELRVHIDRLKAAATGFSPQMVATEIQQAFLGSVPTVLRQGDRQYDIRIRLRAPDRDGPGSLGRLLLPGENGMFSYSGSYLRVQEATGYSEILRENQRRIERLTIDVEGGQETEISDILQSARLAALAERKDSPDKPSISIKKKNQETIDSLQSLVFAFALSCILIYQLLAAQFESFIYPFLIVLSIPLMLPGVALGLLLSGNTVNVTSATGMILLVGNVVNASIILFEAIHERNRSGGDLTQNVVRAARDRLRPILLTLLTTILGLLPIVLPFGETNMQAPMAVVVIGGLIFSSSLSMLIFPTFYHWYETRRRSRS